MMCSLLCRLSLFFCIINLAFAFQEVPQEPGSKVREFASVNEMVDWFESLSESSKRSHVLTKDATGAVTSIALLNLSATDGNIGLLSQFESLGHLRIKCANRITAAGLRKLAKLQALEHLELGLVYGKLPEDFWSVLATLPKLKRIELSHVELSASELEGIDKLSALQRISFQNIKGMTRTSCEQIAKADGLRTLEISRTSLQPSHLAPLDKISDTCSIDVEFVRKRRKTRR